MRSHLRTALIFCGQYLAFTININARHAGLIALESYLTSNDYLVRFKLEVPTTAAVYQVYQYSSWLQLPTGVVL